VVFALGELPGLLLELGHAQPVLALVELGGLASQGGGDPLLFHSGGLLMLSAPRRLGQLSVALPLSRGRLFALKSRRLGLEGCRSFMLMLSTRLGLELRSALGNVVLDGPLGRRLLRRPPDSLVAFHLLSEGDASLMILDAHVGLRGLLVAHAGGSKVEGVHTGGEAAAESTEYAGCLSVVRESSAAEMLVVEGAESVTVGRVVHQGVPLREVQLAVSLLELVHLPVTMLCRM
jgi:hypothetical protein